MSGPERLADPSRTFRLDGRVADVLVNDAGVGRTDEMFRDERSVRSRRRGRSVSDHRMRTASAWPFLRKS